jgi:hypothetical protein
MGTQHELATNFAFSINVYCIVPPPKTILHSQPVTLKRTQQETCILTDTSRTFIRYGALATLTLCVLLVHGYHPLAEDGGVYVAGVESILNPALFPHDLAFATATLHYSLFAPLMAQLVRSLHVPLVWLLLLTYLASTWLMLYATWRIAVQCFRSETVRLCVVALVAAWMTLPIAGTSLLLMDPYVTARTFSTPLSMLAIAFALKFERGNSTPLWRCGLSLAAAAAFHPLMAVYAAGLIAALLIAKLPSRRGRISGWTFLATSAILIASVLQVTAAAESTPTVAAAFSRYYWFLSQWQWFELLGLAGPLVVFALLLCFARRTLGEPGTALCNASIAFGLIATLISVLFVHERFNTHLVGRLQPLRVFLLIYAVMAVLLGSTLANVYFNRRNQLVRAVPPLFVATIACIMFFAQRETFPASQHLELPWRAPSNPWSQAFIWARENTPSDALFALDANYITTAGEDGQTFRAIAQRSMLPDFSKDGGEAAIRPSLAAAWFAGMSAQQNLSGLDDAQRDARLRPLGVSWLLLHSSAKTAHTCLYDNGTAKLCRLDPEVPN